VQTPPLLATVQELKQLQEQLQNIQYGRDKIAIAFTASQQAAQSYAEAAEIWQQLVVL